MNVRMDYGVWTENSRSVYNKWDGVARSTTQVIWLLKLVNYLFVVINLKI